MSIPDRKPDYEDDAIRAWDIPKEQRDKDFVDSNDYVVKYNDAEFHISGFTKVYNQQKKLVLLMKRKHDKDGDWYLFHVVEKEGDMFIALLNTICILKYHYPLRYHMVLDELKHITEVSNNITSTKIKVEDMK